MARTAFDPYPLFQYCFSPMTICSSYQAPRRRTSAICPMGLPLRRIIRCRSNDGLIISTTRRATVRAVTKPVACDVSLRNIGSFHHRRKCSRSVTRMGRRETRCMHTAYPLTKFGQAPSKRCEAAKTSSGSLLVAVLSLQIWCGGVSYFCSARIYGRMVLCNGA